MTAYVINGSSGGGGGAPSGTGVVTVTSGVFDTPSSTDDVVMSGLSGLVGGVAGQAVVGDGAGSVQQTSTDVSALLAAADAAAARAAIGATATGGESWARPDAVTAGLGATYASARDGVLYTSNGIAAAAGNEQSGWSVALATHPGADRCGLTPGSGYCYAGGLDLSTWVTDTTTLAGLFRYAGAPPSISTLVGVSDAGMTGTKGYSVYLKTNGANVDLIAHCSSTYAETVLIASVNPSVGLHAVAVAPVNVGGTDKLRVSWDGSAAADVVLAGSGVFAAPTTTSRLHFFSRSDGYQLVGAGIDLLLYKTLLSSAALAAITAPANVAGYLLDESAAGLNAVAATHRILAQRYDAAFATTLYARGVTGSLTISGVTKVLY